MLLRKHPELAGRQKVLPPSLTEEDPSRFERIFLTLVDGSPSSPLRTVPRRKYPPPPLMVDLCASLLGRGARPVKHPSIFVQIPGFPLFRKAARGG